MSWTTLLKQEIESSYNAADKLIAMTDDAQLGWKPSTG